MSAYARIRHLAALGTIAAALGFGAVPAVAAPAAPGTIAQAPAPGAAGDAEVGIEDDALADIAVCLQESEQLAVALLIDESRSLTQSDPDGRRVDAAENALAGIAELTRSAGSDAIADVMIAGFEDSYDVELPFTRLDDENAEQFDLAFDRFDAAPAGLGTDIVLALTEARAALTAHAAEMSSEGGVEPCSVIVLFTDGVYDLLPRDAEPSLSPSKPYLPGASLATKDDIAVALDRGRSVMCEDDGIADRIRSEDISLIGVMLSGQASRGRFLRSITMGSEEPGAEQTCGRVPANGAFMAAADGDSLIGRFDEVATRFGGGSLIASDSEVPICGPRNCDSSGLAFEVDDLNRAVRILALAPTAGARVLITSPTGETVVAEAGQVDVGGITGTATEVAGRGFAIQLDRPEDGQGWAGGWSVGVNASEDSGETALVQVYTYTDMELTLGVEDMRRGGTATFEANIALPGTAADDTAFESVTGTVRLEDPITGEVRVIDLAGPPEGPLTGEFEVPVELRAASLRTTAMVSATTEAGVAISARSATTDETVYRPEGSIQFGPGVLRFPTLDGEGATTATLIVAGGEEQGCIYFAAPEISGPEDAGAISITYDDRPAVSQDDCIEVAPNETLELQVALSPEVRASGAVRGHITVHESIGKAEGTVTDIPIVANFNRGVDQVMRLALAGGLIAAGLLFPMLLLFLINTIQARFQRLDAVRGAELPVRVRGGEVSLDGEGGPRRFALRPWDFESLADRGSTRSFTFGGVRFRAKASRNPFGGTVAMAAPEAGAEKLKGGVGRKVELDVGLSGSWIFLLDPDKTRSGDRRTAVGTVLAFIAEDAGDLEVEDLKADILRRLPDTGAELGSAVWSKTVKASASTPEPEDGPARGSDEPDGPSEGAADTEGGSAP